MRSLGSLVKEGINANRNADGQLEVGKRDGTCPNCGASNVPTVSGDGGFIWWHPATDCCPTNLRKARDGLQAEKHDLEKMLEMERDPHRQKHLWSDLADVDKALRENTRQQREAAQ